MEFMDFQLYSLAAAIVFNKVFFPDVSPAIGLIAAMATYGVGYVARLAGAVYFGRMGDRIGRRKVLLLTISLMGAATTLTGLLPTYRTVGIVAPILLVVLRLAQGFGAGAEIAGATVMLAEYAPVKRRGLIASLAALGTNSGTLAASGLWTVLLAVLSDRQVQTRGWRIPFLRSFTLLLLSVWMRTRVKESPVFEERADVVNGVALSRKQIAEAAAHGNTVAIIIAMVLGLNIGVLGLFSMESITMAELFGARTRFTQLAVAKEIGSIAATAIGPVLAATLTAVTGHWWPIAAMLIAYSLITFVSAYFSPETRGRDLVLLEDAV